MKDVAELPRRLGALDGALADVVQSGKWGGCRRHPGYATSGEIQICGTAFEAETDVMV